MMVHETEIRVRYGETDQMGYVYYGNYALYYEVGRTEALRSLGLTYRGMEESGVMMPVARMSCEYVKAVKYDDLLRVKTIIKEIPGVRMHFFYEIYNQDNELVNKGETTLVFVDMQTRKLVRCPEFLFVKMKTFFA